MKIFKKKTKTPPSPMAIESELERLALAIGRMAVAKGVPFTVVTLRTYIDLLNDPDGDFRKKIENLQEEYDQLFGSKINPAG